MKPIEHGLGFIKGAAGLITGRLCLGRVRSAPHGKNFVSKFIKRERRLQAWMRQERKKEKRRRIKGIL